MKNENWLLQENNDPKHRSLCTAWKQENDVLDWPSQSPDANPIENVWALMKFKLRGKKIWTVKQLFRQIWFMEFFISSLCYKISRKYASEMPRNY